MFQQGVSSATESYRNDSEFTGNNFENGRAVGETVLCFSSEQGRGNAGRRETAQHSEHSRGGAECLRIDRFSHRSDYRERSGARGEIVPGKKRAIRRL